MDTVLSMVQGCYMTGSELTSFTTEVFLCRWSFHVTAGKIEIFDEIDEFSVVAVGGDHCDAGAHVCLLSVRQEFLYVQSSQFRFHAVQRVSKTSAECNLVNQLQVLCSAIQRSNIVDTRILHLCHVPQLVLGIHGGSNIIDQGWQTVY